MSKDYVLDNVGNYCFTSPVPEDNIVSIASEILTNRAKTTSELVTGADDAGRLLSMQISGYEREVFVVMFLTTRHRLIGIEELFFGTIDGASVYPREVVKKALLLNAAALIIGHNHPSGDATPSQSDIHITQRIKEALALVDIRLLDHIVVSVGGYESLAEKGLL